MNTGSGWSERNGVVVEKWGWGGGGGEETEKRKEPKRWGWGGGA